MVTVVCDAMTLSTTASIVDTVSIHCMGRWSCDHLEADIESVSNGTNLHIICYELQSCDSLSVRASTDTHSNNIRITHSEADQTVLECGHPEDELFIQDDMSRIHGRPAAESGARQVRKPAVAVRRLAQSCVLKIENHIGLFGVGFDCAWLELPKVLSAVCVGTCGDTVLFVHKQSLEMQIALATQT